MSFLDREEPQHFGAGPAQLPTEVLQQAAKDLINYNGLGLGLGEISHRSKEATKVIEDSKTHLRQLLDVPDTHEIIFMQGGGTTGFSSIATNLTAAYVGQNDEVAPAGYLITGTWSQKAYEEAKRLHIPAEIIVNSKDYNKNGKFGTIPDATEWEDKIKDKKLSFLYICENETVHGVEWPQPLPTCLTENSNIELVADLSSNILSRKIDVSKYGVIVAGAQKNIGLAGLTLYIIKKSIINHISKVSEDHLQGLGIPITPIAAHFPTLVKNNSAYNTIPIFTLHVMDLVFQHLIKKGGLPKQQQENEQKAKLLYNALETYPDFYELPVDPPVRSKMNVVFLIKKAGLDDEFLAKAQERKLTGLKGHRSVSGFRASIYNALSVTTVENLVEYINDFAKLHS